MRPHSDGFPLTRASIEHVHVLAGEGGMGKSLLIRLLVQHWRSEGKRVLVCASTAKAARLIGGHTVHTGQ